MRQQPPSERREIHITRGVKPDYYEQLFTIDHETLKTTIAQDLGIGYYQKATAAEAQPFTGVSSGPLYGKYQRPILPLVVACDSEARWVFFAIDGGDPFTYLSIQESARCHLEE